MMIVPGNGSKRRCGSLSRCLAPGARAAHAARPARCARCRVPLRAVRPPLHQHAPAVLPLPPETRGPAISQRAPNNPLPSPAQRRSTLLMLVAALVGSNETLHAVYRHALDNDYRSRPPAAGRARVRPSCRAFHSQRSRRTAGSGSKVVSATFNAHAPSRAPGPCAGSSATATGVSCSAIRPRASTPRRQGADALGTVKWLTLVVNQGAQHPTPKRELSTDPQRRLRIPPTHRCDSLQGPPASTPARTRPAPARARSRPRRTPPSGTPPPPSYPLNPPPNPPPPPEGTPPLSMCSKRLRRASAPPPSTPPAPKPPPPPPPPKNAPCAPGASS